MKRLFKKLLMCATVSGLTIPIVCCAQPIKKEEEEDSKTIKILSDLKDVTIMQDETFISRPVEAKCFDQTGSEKELDIKFNLKMQGNDTLPNWICLTEHNEIKVAPGKEVGLYTFDLVAFNDEQSLRSMPKTFSINVIDDRRLVPDSIELSIEDGMYCMYGEETTLPTKITPKKAGKEERELLKSCDFQVEVLSGNKLDKFGQDLFKFSDTHIDPSLIVSSATDASYTMQYKLKITAMLCNYPNISTSKEITLNIDNIYVYVDSTNNYTYTRENGNDDWTLSLVDSSVKGLKGIKDTIQNKPVSIIGADLCSRSQITSLVSIELPENITTIGDNAFADQGTLCSCKMPGLKNVGNSAFKNDSLLEFSLYTAKPKLVTVGAYGFYNCKKLKLIDNDDLETIGDYAFYNAGLDYFIIGQNCKFIGTEALANCTGLITFKIKTPLPPVLSGGTFSGSYGVKKLYVPADSIQLYKADQAWSSLGIEFGGI